MSSKSTAVVTEKPRETLDNLVHLIVFKLGGEDFGIKIEQIKEVTVTPEITRMPRTPAFIKGVTNIRGDIVAIMDLQERFNIAFEDSGEKVKNRQTYTLVVEADNYKIGLIVQEVPQSLAISMGQIDKAPNIIQENNINQKYIDGIGKLGNRLIIILDIYKILSSKEIGQIADL
jgi:purine-binding chemotaxis protein CheW